ncbi:MAG: hypothetical protein GY845_22410 [Planctomycetes bacterium]|nr:hypothetical protein [Planctomycetota bacterium]
MVVGSNPTGPIQYEGFDVTIEVRLSGTIWLILVFYITCGKANGKVVFTDINIVGSSRSRLLHMLASEPGIIR